MSQALLALDSRYPAALPQEEIESPVVAESTEDEPVDSASLQNVAPAETSQVSSSKIVEPDIEPEVTTSVPSAVSNVVTAPQPVEQSPTGGQSTPLPRHPHFMATGWSRPIEHPRKRSGCLTKGIVTGLIITTLIIVWVGSFYAAVGSYAGTSLGASAEFFSNLLSRNITIGTTITEPIPVPDETRQRGRRGAGVQGNGGAF